MILEKVIQQTNAPITTSVIWLHGLGADGYDFVDIIPQLRLPESLGIRFVFPHAPIRRIAINQNMPMRAWFDIYSLTDLGREDTTGIRNSQIAIEQLIQQEIDQGIPANRIILAGFSQGGAMALFTGLRYHTKLCGILGLSCYLPIHTHLENEANSTNQNIPIFLMHGESDNIIPISIGQKTYQKLQQLGYPVKWQQYSMGHQVCIQQIQDIGHWLASLSN